MFEFFHRSRANREKIAFFVQNAAMTAAYEKQLKSDGHEQLEIDEQLLLAKKYLASKSKLTMYEDIDSTQLVFDSYSAELKDNAFFSALEYQRKHNSNFSISEMIDLYFKMYGITKKLSELILKATIANDEEMLNALKHYSYAIK